MQFDNPAFLAVLVAASLVFILALSLRVSIWIAFALTAGPAFVFRFLWDGDPDKLPVPIIAALIACVSVAVIARVPIRVALSLLLVPLFFSAMTLAIATVLLSDPSLFGLQKPLD